MSVYASWVAVTILSFHEGEQLGCDKVKQTNIWEHQYTLNPSLTINNYYNNKQYLDKRSLMPSKINVWIPKSDEQFLYTHVPTGWAYHCSVCQSLVYFCVNILSIFVSISCLCLYQSLVYILCQSRVYVCVNLLSILCDNGLSIFVSISCLFLCQSLVYFYNNFLSICVSISCLFLCYIDIYTIIFMYIKRKVIAW